MYNPSYKCSGVGYINNKFKPSYDAIHALSKALKVSPGWFFDAPSVPTGDIVAFGKVQRGGTFTIGHFLPMDSPPSPVSPEKKKGIVRNLYWLMFDTLVRGFHYMEPRAGMAYNWKQGGNYWIFDLFEGITFHDGKKC